MKEDDIPIMNYRLTWCLHCKRVLYKQNLDEREMEVIISTCDQCGRGDGVKYFVTGGYKGCLLIWDEVAA